VTRPFVKGGARQVTSYLVCRVKLPPHSLQRRHHKVEKCLHLGPNAESESKSRAGRCDRARLDLPQPRLRVMRISRLGIDNLRAMQALTEAASGAA
jgi:hypothetical protein